MHRLRLTWFSTLFTLTLGAWLALPSLLDAQDQRDRDSAAAQAEADPAERVPTGDRVIGPDEEVDDDVFVVGGDLRVQGRVRGDVVVVNGTLYLEEGGRISGDAATIGGEIVDNGGRVRGELLELDDVSALAGLREALREMDEQDVGDDIEAAVDAAVSDRVERASRRDRGWFDDLAEGIAGIFSTLAFGLVLAGIGSALIFYGRPYLNTVSDTIHGSLLRAGAVGLAAGFLVIPGFVVLLVALAVSIIGIPLLVLAVPLYPLAVAAALAFGLLAAAHALGERTAEQRSPFTIRYHNAYAYLFTGLVMLLAPLFVAYLIGMTGFLGFIATLLKGFAYVLLWAAATVGLGAVVLSRAGTRRTFTVPPNGEIPAAEDPLFDSEPTAAGEPYV